MNKPQISKRFAGFDLDDELRREEQEAKGKPEEKPHVTLPEPGYPVENMPGVHRAFKISDVKIRDQECDIIISSDLDGGRKRNFEEWREYRNNTINYCRPWSAIELFAICRKLYFSSQDPKNNQDPLRMIIRKALQEPHGTLTKSEVLGFRVRNTYYEEGAMYTNYASSNGSVNVLGAKDTVEVNNVLKYMFGTVSQTHFPNGHNGNLMWVTIGGDPFVINGKTPLGEKYRSFGIKVLGK